MYFDFTPIIIAIISLFSAIILKFVVPFLRSKTTAQNWSYITYWAKIFVQSAEVIISGSNKGSLKREKVLGELREKCEQLGISYSENDIRAALENAWLDMEFELVNDDV